VTLTIRRYEAPQPPPVLFRGPWAAEDTYYPGNIAQAGTSLYQAIDEHTGADPTTDALVHWFRVYEGA